ncbi:MAG: outer membrane beta-barrel protein [Woeseiaceae bacterium]
MKPNTSSRLLALAATTTLLSTTGALADDSGWYATANLGLGNLSSATLTYSDGTNSESSSASFDASFAGGGTIGYQFTNRLAVEGEIMYRRNDLDAVDLPGLGAFSGGDFASLGLGINGVYRFPLGGSDKWSGFVAAGYLLLQEIDIDFDTSGQQEVSFETDDGGPQIKFGGRYDATERWFVEAGATYFDAGSVRMELPGAPLETLQSDYESWTLSIGAGFTF